METRRFFPLYGPSAGTPQGTTPAGSLLPSVSVTSTNASATASGVLSGTNNNSFCQIQIANTTTAWAYVNFGTQGAVTAATVASSFPVAPEAVVVVSVHSEVSGASVILGAAPGTNTAVIFTRGEGI